jgi:hypothetical protein
MNPTNILLASASHPVIIDFDSCQPIGTDMTVNHIKVGTTGWSEVGDVADPQVDIDTLAKIEIWLQEHMKHTHGT